MLQWYIAAGIAVACAVIGVFIGIIIRRNIAEKQIGSAEAQAKQLLEDAIRAAETKRKEYLLEAKDEILASRNELEREVKERRADLTRQEQRLANKEDNLDKKADAMEKKEEALAKKVKEADEIKEKITQLHDSQLKLL